jgi:hypothetical protein
MSSASTYTRHSILTLIAIYIHIYINSSESDLNATKSYVYIYMILRVSWGVLDRLKEGLG